MFEIHQKTSYNSWSEYLLTRNSIFFLNILNHVHQFWISDSTVNTLNNAFKNSTENQQPSIINEQHTTSISNLEQKKQTHRRHLMIFVINGTWNTGLASSMWPKCPGHSHMSPVHVRHLVWRSTTPWRGSISPPNFGRPPSVVSGYLMPPSVTDIRR